MAKMERRRIQPLTGVAALLGAGLASCGANSSGSGDVAHGSGAAPSTIPTGTASGTGASVGHQTTGVAGSLGALSGGAPSGGSSGTGVGGSSPGAGDVGGAPPPGSGGAVASSGGTTNGGTAGSAGSAGDTGSGGCSRTIGEAAGLTPPEPACGFEVVSPASLTLEPGAESFYCYYQDVPNEGREAGGFVSQPVRGLRNFTAFLNTGTGGSGIFGGGPKQPNGALVKGCSFGGGQWIYAAPDRVSRLDLPLGVGLPLPAGSQIIIGMRWINTEADLVKPGIVMNVYYASGVEYEAGTMVSFNQKISVPPMGSQTVGGSCTPAPNSNFFFLTTQTLDDATAADVNYVSGGRTTNLVHSTSSVEPDTQIWNAPNYFQTKAGDTFTYSCSYKNPSTTTVTVGETANGGELCMAIGYFFPAAPTTCN